MTNKNHQNNEPNTMSEFYTELYGNVRASEQLKERISSIPQKKRKKITMKKVVCVLAAAAVMITAGSMVVSASRKAEYDTIIINGEAKKARYADFGNDTRYLEYEEGNTLYTAYLFGDYDKDRDTLYFVDCGDYFLVSTDPNPTLNLYTDIDKSPIASLQEEGDETYLYVKDESGTQMFTISDDKKDGAADGRIERDGSVEVYSLLPNGSVVNTMKGAARNNLFDKMFGYDTQSFWTWLYDNIDDNSADK